jgi:hypothetical protein
MATSDKDETLAELQAMLDANKKKETAVGVVLKNGGGAVAGGTLGWIGGGALAVALAPFTGGASLIIPVLTSAAGAVAGHKMSENVD